MPGDGLTMRSPARHRYPQTGASDYPAVLWGRDIGPVSTRNSSKGALLAEAQSIFRAFGGSTSLSKLREQCLQGSILRQPARETRNRIWKAVHWRFFAWNPPRWVLTELAEAAGEASSAVFVGLAYVHYARRDRLTFDFVSGWLWSRWKEGIRTVGRADVMDFLREATGGHGDWKWRESTRKKVAGNLLSALRDFGLLTGVQRKTLQRPVVAPEVVLHLCRLLDAEGLRGRALLEACDWRLFLWDIQDVSHALAKLAQRGELRFERSGPTVVLEVPNPALRGGR